MKKLSFAIAFLLTIISVQAQINFEGGQWNAALKKADRENKIIFIDAYTHWCPPCKRMDKYVFSKSNVGNFYNKNFINVKVDMESNLGRQLERRYNIRSFPTFLFINADGTVVKRKTGYMNSSQFISLGKNALWY